LLAFQEQDREYFFGREEYVEGLLTVVYQQPLVALIGASGSGKSSVVFAGLIPRLRETGNWLIEYFRPQSQASYGLASALVRLLKPELDEIQQLGRAKELLADMEKGLTLPEVLTSIFQAHPHKRILLVIDQFEELYTLCQDTQEQQRFVDALLAAIQSAPNNLTVVLTLRADFFSYVLNYAPFGQALQQHKPQLLSAMNREEMKTAIEQPARKMRVTLAEGLTEGILDDVKQEPGNLPLLEFALTQLWAKQSQGQLTHQAYVEIGGVARALANHAETVFKELNEANKKRAERVFIQLVRPGEGTEDTRCIATREAISGSNWDLVTLLASKRLVVTGWNEKKQAETIEVVHEALIREWAQLRGWVNDNREFRTWQERLKGRMREWEATGDEGALLRGLPLDEAEDWLSKRKEELGDTETNFIQESVALREREKEQEKRRREEKIRQQRRINIVLTSFSLAAMTLAGLAGIGWRSAAINEINSNAKNSSALLSLDGQEALKTSLKAVVQMQHTPWVDVNTRTQVELALMHIVHNVAAPNTLGGHANSVYGVSFSPDGKMLATASADNTLKLWDTSTGKEIKTLIGHTNSVNGVSFSPNGKMLASASDDNTLKLWNTSTGKEIKTLTGHTNSVKGVSFSPNGKMLASASSDNMVKLWDISTGKEITTLIGHTNRVNGVSFSPDGKMLASASVDRTVKLWNTSTGKEIKTLNGHTNWVYGVSFSPDGKMLASASVDCTVKLWNTSTGKEIKTLIGLTDLVLGVSFSPDGKMLATASGDNKVKLWDTSTYKEIKTLIGHTNWVYGVSFSPDSKMLATVSGDNTGKLWDTSTYKDIKTLNSHTNWVYGVSFSPDGEMLASASGDNTVKLWDTNTGKEIKTLIGHTNSVKSISFSRDGKMLASASDDNTVKLWDTSTYNQMKTLTGHANSVNSLSFSPDGKMLATASVDRTVKLWDTSTYNEIKTLTGHTNSVNSLSFSPDGKMLATAGVDNTVKLWDTSTYNEIKTLTGHTNSVNSLSFSPDGKILATAGDDNTIKLWDTSTYNEIKSLIGHTNSVNGVSFSPDGKMLASVSVDKMVKLWNFSTYKEIKTLSGHAYWVYGVSFSPDGKILATASADKTVRLWRRDFDYLLKQGCNFIGEYLKPNPKDEEAREIDKNLCKGKR
jgi:WD40 repeat protein